MASLIWLPSPMASAVLAALRCAARFFESGPPSACAKGLSSVLKPACPLGRGAKKIELGSPPPSAGRATGGAVR